MPKTGESDFNRRMRMRTKGREAEAQYAASANDPSGRIATSDPQSEQIAYKRLKDRRRVLFGDK